MQIYEIMYCIDLIDIPIIRNLSYLLLTEGYDFDSYYVIVS